MGLRLEPSAAVREKRFERLLAERSLARDDARLAGLLEDAELVGSLALSGISVSWEDARASRGADAGPPELVALRRARAAVPPAERVTLAAIRTWHAAIAGPGGLRIRELAPGPSAAGEPTPAAPARFVESRLESLVEWLATAGARDLKPEQAAALALARIVEIRPFDDANGRVSRLAASHILVQGGARPPILVSGDAARLRSAVEAAFRLETGPLVALLVEASSRALDVMIQALEQRLV